MSIISRIKLDHPALGTPGGVALHQKIEAIYKKLGDNMADRFFTIENFNNSTSENLDHNFNTDFSNLRYDLYQWNTVTGELVLITKDTTPAKSDFLVTAKAGNEKTHITITNNSGSQVDLVVTVYHDPIELEELTDVDLETTGPEDGQALVYEASTKLWKPGASGDASFKMQSLVGSLLTIKGGKFRITDDLVLITGNVTADTPVDIVLNLANLEPTPDADTTYWLYVDLDSLPNSIELSDSGQIVRTVYDYTHFKLLKTNIVNSLRYVSVGTIKTNTASWTGARIEGVAYRIHPLLGSFIPMAEKVQSQHAAASTKEVAHNFNKRPELISLVFHDASESKDTPLDYVSHVVNMTDSKVDFDFSSLTFDTGDYVDIFLYFIPNVRDNFAASTHTFRSPWFIDTSVTEINHNLSDMNDIASYSVQSWDITDNSRKLIELSSPVVKFDNNKFYLDWTGFNPSANLRYRIITGSTALPQALKVHDWFTIAAAYTAKNKDKLLADTTGGAFTVTLPADPNEGNLVYLADAKGTWGTNAVTLNGNGKNIEGSATFNLNLSELSVTVIYNGTEWRVYVS